MVEENTVTSIVVELSALAERAEQACRRTSDLVSPARRQSFINQLPVRLTSLSLTS
jgi:hypothetical protein